MNAPTPTSRPAATHRGEWIVNDAEAARIRDALRIHGAARIDPERDARVAAFASRTVERTDTAVAFLGRLALGLALVAVFVWLALQYAEPCAVGFLCIVVPFPPRDAAPSAEEVANLVGPAMRDAYRLGVALGERDGYVAGARAGRVAAFAWGLLVGGLIVAGSFRLGLAIGG